VTSFRVSVGPRLVCARIVTVLLLALAGTAALLAQPQAAHAHDTLLSTDPEDGATVDSSPEKITLEYSANILDVSPVVRITDADGEVVQEDAPTIDGPDAVADVDKPLADGTYTVQWRVVSSDGHPIEGDFSFTVAGSGTQGSTASDAGSGAASDGGSSDASSGTSDGTSTSAQRTTTQGENSLMVPLLIVLGVLAVVIVVAVVVIGRRSRDRD
jgi:methionine-rich copper-binding protein CopC